MRRMYACSGREYCPLCGFPARLLCSDGNRVKYICQRCGAIFVVD